MVVQRGSSHSVLRLEPSSRVSVRATAFAAFAFPTLVAGCTPELAVEWTDRCFTERVCM